MFVMTLNKKAVKKIVVVFGCAVLMGAVMLTVAKISSPGREVAAAGKVDGNTTAVKSTEDMANFLLGYGIETKLATANVSKVSVPKKWDDDFIAFNEVIAKSGFDLSRLKGKTIEKWVIESPNKTKDSETAFAVLLVRDEKVVGGYILFKPSGNVLPLKDEVALIEDEDANATQNVSSSTEGEENATANAPLEDENTGGELEVNVGNLDETEIDVDNFG